MFLVVILSVPIGLYFGKRELIPPKIWLQILRSFSACLGIGFYYWSVSFIHIADAIAVVFVSPLIVTALSPWLLGERPLGFRRIIAVLVGFSGVIIILQPSLAGETPGYLHSIMFRVIYLFFLSFESKISTRKSTYLRSFSYLSLFIFFLLPLLFFFSSPITQSQLPYLSCFAIFSAIGQIGMIAAFRLAAANIVSPFVYFQIIAATFVGYYLFGAVPNKMTWFGIFIITG